MSDQTLRMWVDLLKFMVGTCVIGLMTTMINSQIQTRQVEVEETKQLGAFLEQAIEENVATRRRFASYFATVTRSEAMRERWDEYKQLIEQEFETIQAQAEEAEREAERAVQEIEQVDPANARQEEVAREKLIQARSKFKEAQNELKVHSEVAITSINNGICRLFDDTRIVEIVEEPTHCEVYYTKFGLRDRKFSLCLRT